MCYYKCFYPWRDLDGMFIPIVVGDYIPTLWTFIVLSFAFPVLPIAQLADPT